MRENITWGESLHDSCIDKIIIDNDNIFVEIDVNNKLIKLICRN